MHPPNAGLRNSVAVDVQVPTEVVKVAVMVACRHAHAEVLSVKQNFPLLVWVTQPQVVLKTVAGSLVTSDVCVLPSQVLKVTENEYCWQFGVPGDWRMKALLGERVQLLMPL